MDIFSEKFSSEVRRSTPTKEGRGGLSYQPIPNNLLPEPESVVRQLDMI
jgi:hypothetical protein